MFPRFTGQAIISAWTLATLCLCGLDSGTLSAQEPKWQEPAWYMSSAQIKEWRTKKSIDARNALGANSPTSPQTQLLKESVYYYLSQLLQEQTNPIRDVVDRLLGELNRQATTAAARTIVMDEILAQAPTMLTHPDSQVRTDTMVLAIQLSSVPFSLSSGVEAAVPYLSSYKFLIAVLNDQAQLIECRILAARGLTRIARDGAPGLVEKSLIAVALVAALDGTPVATADDTWWFRYRVIEALGYVDRLDETSGKPIVVDALLKVLANRQELWINRSQAALSISRLPYSGSVNVPLITHEISKLIVQMAEAYGKSPKAPIWKLAFTRAYLAYRPADGKQAAKRWGLLEQVKRPGLGTHERKVLDSWDAAFPIFKTVLAGTGTAVDANDLQKLNAWITDNPPADRSVAPGAPPLAANAQAPGTSGD